MASAVDPAAFRLPLSRASRDRFLPEAGYEDPTTGFPTGFVLVTETAELHRLAARLREAGEEGIAVGGGELAAFAALAEASAHLVARYRAAPGAADAMSGLDAQLGDVLGEEREALLEELVAAFPAGPVDRGDTTAEAYVRPALERGPAREATLASLLILGAVRRNVALTGLAPLLSAPELDTDRLDHALTVAASFFETKPRLSAGRQTLVEMLLAPGRAGPSLGEQLAWVQEHWSDELPEPLQQRLLRAQDELVETHKAPSEGGPGAVELPTVRRRPARSEEFRAVAERPWMPQTVMVAKNTKVWLHQLSERYGERIDRLDRIPDTALAGLAGRGFDTLWLIGLWERSPASRRIKRRRGHTDAEASAYSLYDYHVAEDLGGDEALERLSEQARRHGLRLAADMVPNHTGITSTWMVDHPEWFLGTDAPPYPSYTFTGPDLARDPRIEVRIEDGYWDHSDAAVVFERRDKRTGATRYVYHGNDGTQMPWNDTAQLDFTRPDVRAAVLETILEVAQRFPVLRFDAAMTLTRFHYQRLWFPTPGSAGAVPSRARHGMTAEELEAKIPREFWREVVEAAAERVPNALFMAEAFWLTETLFVRELGMHRVYNSAFMKMLSAERNAEYRGFLKEIVANDPGMLGRFVNFMTNPDEEPAAALFGKGDKYLGVATLLVTLPGLPMFGHGQVEGLNEKYGMEFQRSYRTEQADAHLVRRHYEEIVPLLRRRELFSGTEHFRLFDLIRDDGTPDDNVFAYVNGRDDDRVVVAYNNSTEATRGWLRDSAPHAPSAADAGDADASDADSAARSVSFAEALGLPPDATGRILFRDKRTNMEWALTAEELVERGLPLALRGYQVGVWRLER